ncbi:MAG: SRPBCC domain-containing protein [Candidatus Microgenomates bacterium]|jgi:activator of HSP90 ATPase
MIKQEYLINAPIEEVWEALTEPKIIDMWGGGPAKMKAEENYEFSLWGGDIHGKNIKVAKGKTLKQEWYSGKWQKPSIATFNLSEKGEKTKVELIHNDVPENETKDISDGWKDYYMGPLKRLLEKK